MATKLFLLSTTGVLLGGFYFRKKEIFYQDLFDDLRKCPKFHMDYVQDVAHLPLDKPMILFGPPNTNDGSEFISPSFITKSKEEDRLWKLKLKSPFSFFTGGLQPIEIQPSGSEIMVFNLPPTQRQLKDQKYQQRSIIHGVGLCVYGKLQSQGKNYKIVPQLLIGNKSEAFLTYLDKQMVKLNKKSKILSGVGAGMLVCHLIYKNMFTVKEKSEIEKDIQSHK